MAAIVVSRWPLRKELRVDFDGLSVSEIPPTTECKHGRGACEKCGTTNARERLHTTWGGKGAVARISKR